MKYYFIAYLYEYEDTGQQNIGNEFVAGIHPLDWLYKQLSDDSWSIPLCGLAYWCKITKEQYGKYESDWV